MNILVPHHWMLEHLETEADPQTIQRELSLCGPAVEQIINHNGEHVYDIEVTTNRVDSMSIRGIAREAAVILNNAGYPSRLKEFLLTEPHVEGSTLPFPHIDNQSQLCHRISGIVLSDIQHSTTPEWMRERLEQVELNVKDIIIDITNYLTHELGHPCHVFDYDKIVSHGNTIKVVTASAGQKFTTLDSEEHTTQGGEVVFINNDGVIIDLPAIMGTQNTAVDRHTKNILFWIESIPGHLIRQASMAHGLRTPAAQLNERDLDHHLAREVMLTGIQMYQELTSARVASPLFDEVYQPSEPARIALTQHDLIRYLGIEIPTSKVQEILEQLGCTVTPLHSDQLEVICPTFRTDLSLPADLIEEVARIYGYHNLPSVLMTGVIPTNYPEHTDFHLEEKVKQLLADLGYQELYTYSMISREQAEHTPEGVEQHLAIQNPLTSDMEYMRRRLLPSHLPLLSTLVNKSTTVIGSFEMANRYLPRPHDLPEERWTLVVTNPDFRHLRSTLDILATRLYWKSWEVRTTNTPSVYQSAAEVIVNGEVVGTLGYVTSEQAGMELDWQTVLKVSRRWPQYQPIARTSPYLEDWTLTLPPHTPIGEIMAQLRQLSPWITAIELIGEYQHNWTFRVTFQDSQRQLSAEDVAPLRSKVPYFAA